MADKERLYPLSEELFNAEVLPVIEGNYKGQGRPPEVSHYDVFCGILYILRTGIPWRDLPEEFGYWHVVYDRFSRGNQNGLWAKVLLKLQERSSLQFEEVIIDSTSLKVHRHGGGQKGGFKRKGSRVRA
jgi:transposase